MLTACVHCFQGCRSDALRRRPPEQPYTSVGPGRTSLCTGASSRAVCGSSPVQPYVAVRSLFRIDWSPSKRLAPPRRTQLCTSIESRPVAVEAARAHFFKLLGSATEVLRGSASVLGGGAAALLFAADLRAAGCPTTRRTQPCTETRPSGTQPCACGCSHGSAPEMLSSSLHGPEQWPPHSQGPWPRS